MQLTRLAIVPRAGMMALYMSACLAVSNSVLAADLLTLKRLYVESVQNAPDQKNSLIDLAIADNTIHAQQAGNLPAVNLATEWVESNSDGADYQEINLSLNQPIYNLPNVYKLKLVNLDKQITQQKVIEQQQALLLEIADLYTQVLIEEKRQMLLQQSLTEAQTLLQQSLTEAQTLHKIVDKAVVLEQRPPLDLYRAAADVADKQAQLIVSKSQKQQLSKQLMRYLATPVASPQWVAFAADDFASDDQLIPPTLRRLMLEKKRANVAIEEARSALYPTVDLTVEFSHRQSASALQTQTIKSDEARGTLSFNWDLYSGNANHYLTENARKRRLQKENEYDNVQLELGQKTQSAQALIAASENKLQALNQTLQAQQHAIDKVERSWQLGLVDISEIQREYSALFETELTVFTEQRTIDLEKLRLLFYTGTLQQ